MGYTHLIKPGSKVKLKDFAADYCAGLSHEEAVQKTVPLIEELVDIQEVLYAANQLSVLVVLQGRDTSGKDGVIRHVTGPLNSQGCEVVSFKVPTEEELSHDFLWRVHANTPKRGEIKIFNRSHYEDVLVVRVHNLVPEKVWKKRYDHINDFERLLHDSNTLILKFYLHISKKEQEARLLEREKNTTKAWKLSVGDWKEREYWNDYAEAYEDVLSRCSTDYAPWHIVPSDKKWFRNLAITETLVEALRPYRKEWMKRLEEVGRKELAALREYRGD